MRFTATPLYSSRRDLSLAVTFIVEPGGYLRADLERLAPEMHFPVAIFQSEHDGIVRPDNAAYLKSIFPQAAVTMVPGTEHALPVFIPDAIDAAVLR